MHISEELLTRLYDNLMSLEYYADLTLFRIKDLYELSYFLGFDVLNKKTKQLILNGNYKQESHDLGSIKFKKIDQGKFEEKTIHNLLQIRTIEELSKEYSKWTESYYKIQFNSYSKEYPQITTASNGDYAKAIQECFHPEYGLNGQCLELIISYLFIIGNFDKGIEIKKKYVKHDFSIRYLQIVEMIERVRYDGWDKHESNFRKSFKNKNVHEINCFARGFSGILPHSIYPWTDEWEFH